jgi:PAS domain S-box-containing protein
LEGLHQGANDYIIKDRIGRLNTAVKRALADRAQKQLLNQLKDAYQLNLDRFHAISNSIRDGLIVADENGHVQEWNPAAEEMFGYTPDNTIGCDLHELIASGRYRQEIYRGLEMFRSSGDGAAIGRTLELEAMHRDGHEFPVELSLSSQRSGEQWHAVCLVRDITQRRQTEQALRESESVLRALIYSSPDLIWLKDPDGKYLACNSRFERLYGATEADIVGKTDYDFVASELADFFRAKDRAAMAAGGPCINEEALTFSDDGHTEIVETIKTPLFNTDGGVVRVLGCARDVTERNRSTAALAAQLDELRRWQDVLLGREMRQLELKREINAMLKAQGEPPRYPAAETVVDSDDT